MAVADLSTMWAVLDIPEADSREVRAGQKVSLVFEGLRGATVDATITRVGTSVDPHTRTVRARVEVPNPDHSLKAGLFVRARVQVAAEHDAIIIPADAVQRAQNRDFVFVKRADGAFDPIGVEIAHATPTHVEVVKGLSPGVEVVTTGAFLLKTEILKESIGAGCCEVEGAE